ncbi:MAG: SDR family oxidoreductase [bacterium]|nr:SDR family oxidoreductase [bacterium]
MVTTRRVLVTGGAGFLGSNLCERLIHEGHAVLCLDNFYTGKNENIAHLLKNPNFQILQHDIIEPLELERIDAIYHLACPASPPHYQADSVKTLKTSVFGMVNMLELARKTGARILFASTSEVYGDPLEHPQKETYWGNVNPIGIRACYDEGKRVAEAFCMDYHRQYNVPIRIARIFNTYGPYMRADDGRIISNFVTQALRGEPLTVYGDGSQTRSFCYVDDLIEGLVRLMASDYVGPVNLGNPDEYSVYTMAQKIIALTESQSAIVLKPLPEDDPKQRKPDISLAKEVLNWQPITSLGDGLAKTILYFKSTL